MVSIVTGAGSGIGRATALLLARAGHSVVLAARREQTLHETAGLIERASPGATTLAVRCDMGAPADILHLMQATLDRFGRIDVLVNNAALAPMLPIEHTGDHTIDEVFRVNAIGPALAIRHVWPVFLRQGSGCIVNVSTIGTIDPFSGFFAYASSKASLNLMARSCAIEGRGHGIRAFAVAPGAVETPMLRAILPEHAVAPADCLTPEEVAAVIVDCIRGRRDQDNGNVIPVVKGKAI